MALTFPFRARLFSFDRKVVTFFGKDGERMVECAIATEALEARFGAHLLDHWNTGRSSLRHALSSP